MGGQEKGQEGEIGNEEDMTNTRNTMIIARTAQTSMRHKLSVCSTAAVCTARYKVLEEASEQGARQTEEDSIQNIMFDSRIDETKVRQYDEETGRYYAI